MDMTSYVKQELRKIAFFIQHSGIFDGFPSRLRNDIEELQVEWQSVDTKELSDQQDPTSWNIAQLLGKLEEKPFKLNIKRTVDRNFYTLFYEGKKYGPFSSMKDVQDNIESLVSGKTPIAVFKKQLFTYLSKYKNILEEYLAKHFLYGITTKPWTIKVTKDTKQIFIRFFVETMDEKEKDFIDKKLKEHNTFRLNRVNSYLQTLPTRAGIQKNVFDFDTKVLNSEKGAGILVTVK